MRKCAELLENTLPFVYLNLIISALLPTIYSIIWQLVDNNFIFYFPPVAVPPILPRKRWGDQQTLESINSWNQYEFLEEVSLRVSLTQVSRNLTGSEIYKSL